VPGPHPVGLRPARGDGPLLPRPRPRLRQDQHHAAATVPAVPDPTVGLVGRPPGPEETRRHQDRPNGAVHGLTRRGHPAARRRRYRPGPKPMAALPGIIAGLRGQGYPLAPLPPDGPGRAPPSAGAPFRGRCRPMPRRSAAARCADSSTEPASIGASHLVRDGSASGPTDHDDLVVVHRRTSKGSRPLGRSSGLRRPARVGGGTGGADGGGASLMIDRKAASSAAPEWVDATDRPSLTWPRAAATRPAAADAPPVVPRGSPPPSPQAAASPRTVQDTQPLVAETRNRRGIPQ
jgi:hypothetical protein